MNTIPTRLGCAMVLSAVALLAQAPTQKPTFHLRAGEYSIGELLDQAELAVHHPIARSDEAMQASPGRVRLQTDLVLGADSWRDALGAVLYSRGFVLTFDPVENRHEALPAPRGKADWIAARAEVCTVEQLFDNNNRYGPVRVQVPTTLDATMCSQALGPWFAVRGAEWIGFANEADKTTATGLADVVRFALRHLSNMDPALATKLPAPIVASWPRAAGDRRFELAKGKHSARQLVDRLASELRRNVLVVDDELEGIPEVVVELAMVGDAFAFEERISQLLWQAGLLVVAIAPGHGLYDTVRVNGRRTAQASRLAAPMSAAEVVARKDLVTFTTVAWKPQHLSQDAVNATLRTVMAGAGVPAAPSRDLGLTVNGSAGGALLLAGLTLALEPALTALMAQDQPPAPAK